MSRNTHLAEKLFNEREETGDVKFIVDGKKVRAHRNILAAFSPKYKAQLYDTALDKDNIVIEGVTVNAFMEFLRLFYFNKVDLTYENIGMVLDLSVQSFADDFVADCVEFLKQKLVTENFWYVYHLAIFYDIKELINCCEQSINKNPEELFAANEFLQCDRVVLLHILKSDSLHCKEVDIFDACIAWARSVCQQKAIDAKQPENLRAELGDAIYQVRFGSMTTMDFIASYEPIRGFFSPDEFYDVMCIIGSLKGFKSDKFNQTPRGLCLSLLNCDFECKRILHFRNPDHVLNLFEEGIDFKFSEQVKVIGFALSTPFPIENPNEFRISIKIPPFGSSFLLKYTVLHSNLEDEKIVCFKKPIAMSVSERMYVRMTRFDDATKPQIFKQIYELTNEVKINDVTVTFNGNFPIITRVFFNRHDDPITAEDLEARA